MIKRTRAGNEMANMNRKTIIRIEIDPADADSLKEVCSKRGMTQISLVSRMVKWLARQDSEVQSDILNTDHKSRSKSGSVKLLKRLASPSK
jgi:hypothetical protein